MQCANMVLSNAMHLGLIADDFTGALDSGARLAEMGFGVKLELQPGAGEQAETCVVCTNSREIPEAEAVQCVKGAAQRLKGRRIYKKIDSTLRGHIGAEALAVLETMGMQKALVCPAAPSIGRTVYAGQLLVNGSPINHSSFAQDPTWPATSADITKLVGGRTSLPVTHLNLETVRAGKQALCCAIDAAPTALVTLEAVEESDLDAIASAATSSGSQADRWLLCGSLGLAQSWGMCMRDKADPSQIHRWLGPSSLPGPLLVAAGSSHSTTRHQIDFLVRNGSVPVISVSPGVVSADWLQDAAQALQSTRAIVLQPGEKEIQPGSAWQGIAAQVGKLAAHLSVLAQPGVLLLSGGETALAAINALQAASVCILGDLQPGLALGQLQGGLIPGQYVVTKAGGLGSSDCLLSILKNIRPGS
jgi:D-threonate/D-erythronate kinase